MRNLPAAPELRSPQSLLRRLRRNAVLIEIAVALAIVVSICTLVYAIAHVPSVASTMSVAAMA
jgi:uncharacterized membrane protein